MSSARASRVDPIRVFSLRSWARAYLFRYGWLGLHEAVDLLAHDADRDGIDTDQAQATLAAEFGAVRC